LAVDEIVDISGSRVKRRRQTILRVGGPVLGVALVILSILGISLYSYQANRAGALVLSGAVLDGLQARIAREVSSYLDPATQAALIARDMVSRNAVANGQTAIEGFAASMLSQVPNLEGFYVANGDGDFTMVRRDPAGGTDTKLIINLPGARHVSSVHLDAAGQMVDSVTDPKDDFDPRERVWYQFGPIMPSLAAVGHFTRARAGFPLMLAAASWGVLREAMRPVSWRRTVHHEFKLAIRQATGGGLATAMVTASLAGVAMVYEALYWLGVAGQAQLTGSILVTVLVRELTPLLVGLILLGRSGMLTVTELGMLQAGGQIRAMQAQGIDPFLLLLVLPRTLAFALSGFTLGVIFAATALVFGFIVSGAIGSVQDSLWTFLDRVLQAMTVRDYMVVPMKLLVIGLLVGLSSCLTGLGARDDDDLASLIPRGFVRGILVIMVTSILFTMAA